MTLLAIFGCTPTTRELPVTLEGVSMDATIEQTTERRGASGEGYSSDLVRVVLQDREGRMIEREDLCITLNSLPLEIRAAHGNYYDRHPFYRLDDAGADLPPNHECRFTVQLPDGTHHDAGMVRTPKRLVPEQFEFPETLSRREPLVIEWTELEEPVELVIFRSHSYTNLNGTTVLEDGSAGSPDALRRTIGPGLFRRANGSLMVPASFLADHGGRRVRGIGVQLSSTHSGEVREPFARTSTIQAIRRLVFYADLTD
jgi:hypothetical protein